MSEIVGLANVPRAASSRFAAIGKLGCPVSTVTRRGAGREAAICQAVVELLNETSYESVTMDAVAARAKASKATIYRRWSNKNDLVVDALRRVFEGMDDVLIDTGSLRDDIVARMQRQLQDPVLLSANTAALKSLVYAASDDEAFAASLRETLRDAQFAALQGLLDRAFRRGEVRRPVDAALVFEVAQAQFCARTGVDAKCVDAGYVQHLVDDVLMPVIRHAGAIPTS
ncbi:DNA-binding transcriptional regulator, AcrR family [Nakamurella panacisegetis]|uniref:DNA-binding transcriptional regulator, AcrR family n=1 Tax=Nakamurella panacisegetis TaxID=1090615 RepID=A0A1H0RQI4_9ACTN|nr:TetR/AcrR family transcriptional regulator [Nakamurella panacisegetis]SDP31754.1 DNA-binding transcriptional regulator, AcrR family [Nakamurella panacisegetis]